MSANSSQVPARSPTTFTEVAPSLPSPSIIAFHESDSKSSVQLDLLVTAAREGRLVPFVGAGISMDSPANLPSGKSLEHPLKVGLLKATRRYVRGNGRKCIRDLKSQVEAFRLEPMLEALQQVHGREFVELYLAPLNADIWNENHAILAALADKGYIRHCITLNFDCLLELAFERHGASITICPLLEESFNTGSAPIRLCVTKPHGSFRPGRSGGDAADLLCGAISEIGDRPSEANRRAIRPIVSECPTLLVAGYSNHDWDISPILFELRREIDHVFWIEHARDPRNHKPDKRQEIVRQLLQTFDVRSTIIIAKTDSFLRSLARRLDTTPLALPKTQKVTCDLDASLLTRIIHDAA